jgi:beta-galactosidase
MNMTWIDICDVHAKAGFRLDVFGANYINDRRPETYDEFHAKYPDWPLCGVENASTWSARGVYVPCTLSDGSPPPPVGQQWLRWANPTRKDFVSAYGDLYPQWGGMPEEAWRPVAERPHVAGTFVWTGFDYRGETGPYPWPAVSSNFGILDLCGFPKDIYYYYKAWWSGEPVLHLFPHWTWPGREGQTIDVWCFANCASVELFLNGTSLDRQDMPPNGHLEWRVVYVPGKLEAIGYDARGVRRLSTVVETTGVPQSIRVTPDRVNLRADGADVAVIEVAVVDAAGRVVPDASHDVRFELSGPARIIGVGNGDPFSHESDKTDRRRAFCGLCQVLMQTTEDAGRAVLTATSAGLIQGRVELHSEHSR